MKHSLCALYLSTAVLSYIDLYLYLFVGRLGVVVLISFAHPSHPSSPDYQMFGNKVTVHTYIEL